MKYNHFSQEITIFHGRSAPEIGNVVGYAAIILIGGHHTYCFSVTHICNNHLTTYHQIHVMPFLVIGLNKFESCLNDRSQVSSLNRGGSDLSELLSYYNTIKRVYDKTS
jgi:hypothetical protein